MNQSIESDNQVKFSEKVGTQQRRLTIGYLAFLITDDLGRAWWSGVSDTVRQQGANLICFRGGPLLDRIDMITETTAIYELANRQRVDGWVLGNIVSDTPAGLRSLQVLRDRQLGPYVAGLRESLDDIPYVFVDNYHGAHQVVTHLINVHGCRRIAYLRGPGGHPYAQERYRAYLDVLQENGLPFDANLVTPPCEWFESSIEILLDERKLKPSIDFDAIVSVNDLMALKAIDRLTKDGIHIPQDVTIIGFNNNLAAEVSFPPLSTVMLPFYSQGARAAEMALMLITDRPLPKEEDRALPAQLIIRQSCGCRSPLVTLAGEGANAGKYGFHELTLARREQILAEVVQVTGSEAIIVPFRQMLEGLVTELAFGKAGVFTRELTLAMELLRANWGDPSIWQKALSALRRLILPYMNDDMLVQFEKFWQQAQVMLSLTIQRVYKAEALQAKEQTRILRGIGAALAAAFDLNQVMDILARDLPNLDIPGCYVSLYDDPQSPAEWSRLLMAYNADGRLGLGPEGIRFPSGQLLPDSLWPQDRQFSLVIEPIHYQKKQLGFIVFEVGSMDGAVYEILASQISGALYGALLVQRVEKAYAEVEKQVTERTVELQQEIAARKQAEIERENLLSQMAVKNAELEARNTELERFTYTVSHDLKAPLITIRGFLGYLEKDAMAGNIERFKADSTRIVEATDKMQRLLTELLELSRIGRMVNPPQVVPFEEIVSDALGLVSGRSDQCNLQILVAAQLPVVYGDRARLVEVVQNLVDNACKFMGDQPAPRVEIGQSGEEHGKPIFFVRDNGMGIAPEFHERIFGLFNKLDAKSEGTGVGLALVKRIIEVHGGRIWVESDGRNHGTTFYFSLPGAEMT
jgi:signal transduction histidine kinase/DNA-binding LacI/PurR family transcriptional regulator